VRPQGNRKTEAGDDHPDRDAQFRHINRAVKHALRTMMTGGLRRPVLPSMP
jgi:hypothetical protein